MAVTNHLLNIMCVTKDGKIHIKKSDGENRNIKFFKTKIKKNNVQPVPHQRKEELYSSVVIHAGTVLGKQQ